jgi:glycosyltransferase involved in cell wall biosynthesis
MHIHIAIDRPGAAFHRIARHLQHEARLRGHIAEIVWDTPTSTPDLLIAVWYGFEYWDCYQCEKWLMVYDYFTWQHNLDMRNVLAARIGQATRRFASNDDLKTKLEIDSGYWDFETVTDGVDTDMFYPRPKSHEGFRIGWVGNSNLGGGIKRKALVERVCERAGVELACADMADKPVKFADMHEFYACVDALVIATDPEHGEGTPNPGLEAVAMNIPVFSTRVGIMPQLAEQTSLVRFWETEQELEKLILDQQDFGGLIEIIGLPKRQWSWPVVLAPLTKYLGPEVPRKKLLVIYDSPGWCLERIAGQLELWLDEYDVQCVGYHDEHPSDGYAADLIIALTYMALPAMLRYIPNDAPYIVCQFDEVCWVKDPKAHAAFTMSLDYASGWMFANGGMKRRMLDIQNFTSPVIGTCQDGVDLEAFPLQPYREDFDDDTTPLRVLWVGNSDTTYFGTLKGLDIIKQAVTETDGVELWTADKNDVTARFFGEMSDIYGQTDVTVCMSSSEGTPNSALESLASGRVVISTRVGITEEINEGIIFVDRNVESLKWALSECLRLRATLPLVAQRGSGIVRESWSWEHATDRYRQMLQRVQQRRDTKVFLIHCGEPTVDVSREALKASDGYGSEWTLHEIENVAPMDAAFNAMLEQADTTYHVQVDADMVLKPNTINDLRQAIRATADNVAFVCRPLWDTLFHRAIDGVKIYRSDIVKRYPYEASRHCEVNQRERFEAEGFKAFGSPDYPEKEEHALVAGQHRVTCDHVAFWNCYDRSMRSRWVLEHKGYNWFEWMNPYYKRFLLMYESTDDTRYLWGYLGLITGQCAPIPNDWGEKDYRNPPEIYERLKSCHDKGLIK